MEDNYHHINRTYIKSNTKTVMRFLWFVSVLLLVLVSGFCVFVVFGSDNNTPYHWQEDEHFYYSLSGNQATVVKFVDVAAESCTIPTSVTCGGKSYPVTVIGAKAFTNHSNLKTVKISDTVVKIEGDDENQTGAFSGCTALTAVDLGHGIIHIGKYAFKNCLNLQAVEFPASVQFIDDGAFQGCLEMTSIRLNSNGVLGSNCFADCLHVTTLSLADDVCLSENTCQVLSDLNQLSNFEITDENSLYYVRTVGNGQCLVTTTDNENDTLVLGGRGAVVPVEVTRINDWAWGQRAATNLYVPSSVTSIGANSFYRSAICTDATTKPVEWMTTVPVHTQAQLITFVAEGDVTRQAYIYHDANREVYPDYDDLFAEVVTETPFIEWGSLAGTTCHAIYESKQKPTSLTALNTALAVAEPYLNDAETRLKFTFDFWEKFKTLYYTAAAINDPNATYQYFVDDLIHDLTITVNKIQAANDTVILESTDWRVDLQKLVSVIKELDVSDLSENTDTGLLNQLTAKIKTAEHIIPNNEIDDETGKHVLSELRDMFECLEVNVGADSQLAAAIVECENLQRTNYTKASWQKLQTQLALAKQMTKHNLSISSIREKLNQIRADLREVDLSDNLTRLKTWLSICLDLPQKDYEDYEYDRLQIETGLIIGDAENLINDTKVNNAINNLSNRYASLVLTNQTAEYKTENTILNRKSVIYFIVVVMMFTGAVASGATAARLQKLLRQSRE